MLNHKNCRWIFGIFFPLLTGQIAFSQETGTSQQRIFNGDFVPEGELEAVGRLPGCTATLIEPDLVLTAAHCVCKGETSPTGCLSESTFTLTNVRPVDDPTTSSNESTTRRNISMTGSVSVHPRYTSTGWLSHDFATLRLKQPVTKIALDITPTSLELPTQRPNLGDNLTIVGFGVAPPCTATTDPPNDGKQKVTLPLHEITTDNVTLRIGTNDAGACPGDSGGPALNDSGNIVGVSSSKPGNYDPTDLAYNWIYPDTFSVEANGKHGFHFEFQDKHQFYLESAYPITENGRITYQWDNVRDSGDSRFIRRLNIINKSNFPVSFRQKVTRVSIDKIPHTVEKDETASVEANGEHGFHFEFQDKHQFYLESVYPITENGRITYQWDNVRDPGDSRYIRRLVVKNKSDFPVTFKIKVVKVNFSSDPLSPISTSSSILEIGGLFEKQILDTERTVDSNGKTWIHVNTSDKHHFYLESIYPTTVNGRLTYEWDNVGGPGDSRFRRRLVVINKSDIPISFKIKVIGVTYSEGIQNEK